MKVTDRSPTPKNSSSQRPGGRLLAAFLCGCFVTVGVLNLLRNVLYVSWVSETVEGVLSLLAGGLVSGAILEPDLDTRRWRLMWLLFASPTILIWCAAVFVAIYDAEEISSYLPEIVGFCFPPAVGAVIGYSAAHRYRLRKSQR